MMKEERIKISLQKSGRLTDHTLELLQKCGLVITKGNDQLIAYGENGQIKRESEFKDNCLGS